MPRVTRVYLDLALAVGKRVGIDGQAAHHLLRVLRARRGDRVTLFNGDGQDFSGEIVAAERHSASVLIDEQHPSANESPLKIVLGQCISRAQRMDLAIQKAVELGAWEIVPLVSERSHSLSDPRAAAKKMEHWRAIIISACEQSGRGFVPVLHPLTAFKDFVQGRNELGLLTLVPSPTAKTAARDISPPADSTLGVAIGPEGGFSTEEMEWAEGNQAQLISLGPRILRTETATIAALSLLQGLWGDC